ncbi:hypothetical protein EHS25_003348 [Saitozyma podzolica]|uniref:Vacuolar protein-sorting-associated protein 36 n=1 Tax=Saitozyma podzolica TaxID=1890683 RepID=A0A427Y8L4_9TREE|nr:hypothetical protein EHS25_003348 [Saitozyma podzolica]
MSLPSGLSAQFWRPFYPGKRVSDSLEPGEEWIGSWDNVGLYEGNNKVPSYQVLAVHLTTHRLLLVPTPNTALPSPTSGSSSARSSDPPALQTNLSYVRQTEFYNGFMRSSAKITLFLGPSPTAAASSSPTPRPASETASGGGGTWTCGVCGMVNSLASHEASPALSAKCVLCGVAYSASRTSAIPPSRVGTPGPPGSREPDRQGKAVPAPDVSNTQVTEETGDGIACPACTFLNHKSMTACEICSTPLQRKAGIGASQGQGAQRGVTAVAGGGVGVDVGSSGGDRLEVVRLSFRKGGEKEAYRKLKSVLTTKAWETETSNARRGHRPDTSSDEGRASPRPGAGIDGILQSMSLEAKAQDESMQSAFRDLEVLMVRAGEMVRLAQNLNAKLTASQSAGNAPSADEATLIRTSLVQLGLPAPALTSDMVKSDREYHEGLAIELGGLLTGHADEGGRKGKAREGLMVGPGGRGVIGLDEVWGLWMRARGVALLSPSTLIAILPFLSAHTTPPIRALTLPSSLMVLYSPIYSPQAILFRLLAILTPSIPAESSDPGEAPSDNSNAHVEPSLSLIEIAAHEGLAVGLAKELIEEVERISGGPSPVTRHGVIEGIVRDEQAEEGSGGVRWYRDLISAWPISAM